MRYARSGNWYVCCDVCGFRKFIPKPKKSNDPAALVECLIHNEGIVIQREGI